MFRSRPVKDSGIPSSAVVVVLFLCVCVVLQMLGVPVTLLNPSDSSDALGGSVLEGFSVMPALPEMILFSRQGSFPNVCASAHVPILASALFHPPVETV